jgi:hypothetical protein
VWVAFASLALACGYTIASASAADEPPDASFAFFPANPVAGQVVRFVSYACDPDGSRLAQSWDLDNDGIFNDAVGAEALRAFEVGSHTVGLQVMPVSGAPVTRTTRVDVSPAPEYPLPANVFTPPFLIPFPIVRLVGRLTETGVRIRALLVRAPVCSRVTTRCRGRGCPFRKTTRFATRRAVRVRAIQGKRLRAGVRLEVLVSKRDRIGKFTRFEIRRDKPPRRVDRCLRFGATTPIRCVG